MLRRPTLRRATRYDYAPQPIGLDPDFVVDFQYDEDRRLTGILFPDGRSLSLAYDSVSGKLQTQMIGRGTYTFTYDTAGRLSTVEAPDQGLLTLDYDGSLLTSSEWT